MAERVSGDPADRNLWDAVLSSPAMAIRIIEIHPAPEPGELNTEWFILENQGQRPFSTRGCNLFVHKKQRASATSTRRKSSKKNRGKRAKKTNLGTIDPGFSIGPGEQVRVTTGNPGRKAHGKMPEDDMRGYSLFLNESVLRGPGSVLTLSLRSLRVTRATFDPDTANGIASEANASASAAPETDATTD